MQVIVGVQWISVLRSSTAHIEERCDRYDAGAYNSPAIVLKCPNVSARLTAMIRKNRVIERVAFEMGCLCMVQIMIHVYRVVEH